MYHIDEVLTNQSRDRKFEASIRMTVSIAKRTLNKYYDKTDDSEVYRIAMGMFSLHFQYLPHVKASSLSPTPPAQA